MSTATASTNCPKATSTRPATSAIATQRGRLFLAGRAHDVIKTGGYKIYPEEIERVLPPGVAVVGIPSAHWGEVIVAVAETEGLRRDRRRRDRGAGALQAAARVRGDRELPRSLQGKVQRARMREMVLARYTS